MVGYGSGKAKEVPQAIRKGIESAKKNLIRVNLTETTIPHQVLGRYGSGQVLLKPAPEGTGVIAGGAVRAVMTSAGMQNVLTKIDRHHQSAQRHQGDIRRADASCVTARKSRRCAARPWRSCNHGTNTKARMPQVAVLPL